MLMIMFCETGVRDFGGAFGFVLFLCFQMLLISMWFVVMVCVNGV